MGAQNPNRSSRVNSTQPVEQSQRVDIDDEVLCHSPSPQTTPTTSFASNSRRRGANEDVMTLKTCAEIMPQRVADKLQGLPTCKECNREYTREVSRKFHYFKIIIIQAYNLHMLSQHGTFVGITSKQILTHVRTLCQEAFARIVWWFVLFVLYDYEMFSDANAAVKTSRQSSGMDSMLSRKPIWD